jgi:hypothetical protein
MTTDKRKKHKCPDCRQCQHCSDVRCNLCRGQGATCAEKRFSSMSMAEQIELYESINKSKADRAK